MKILVFIIFIGIASVVFYLFLRRLFEDRIDKAPSLPGDEKIKPLLPKEEIKQDQDQVKDSEPQDTVAKEAEKQPTEEVPEDTKQTPLEAITAMDQDLKEDQD